MGKQDEMLEVLSKQSLKELVKFFLQCKSDGASTLQDTIAVCREKELMMQQIYALVEPSLKEISTEENIEDGEKLEVLQSMILLMSTMLTQEDVNVYEPMFQMADLLKDSFKAIPPSKDTLKNSLARLFEDWWHKNLYQREHLIGTTFLYLLDRSLDITYKEVAAIVKRVKCLQDFLCLVDLNDVRNQELRDLLHCCFISPRYLKNEQGVKFLANVISLDDVFTASVHQGIKNQLPTAPRQLYKRYGEVYFRGWQILYKTGGKRLLDYEQNCVQDLMALALKTKPEIATIFRKLLGYMHSQKKIRGVEEMLCRLYEPLIWRMCSAPNERIRGNAIKLFFDVFPITNPDLKKEEAQKLLDQQFEQLTFLLSDPWPENRSLIVIGICQVLTDFWELFTEKCMKDLLKVIVNDLRLDTTSKTVRESSIRGFILLLDNPLTHTTLKAVLPKLRNSFHDVAEVVRVAMVDLLLKVKKIPRIKFWDVVPVNHLLARLAHDDDPVKKRLMLLLFDNFVSLNETFDVKIDRIMYLIENNPLAMREFFRLASKHMSLQESVDYILTLCKAVLLAVKRKGQTNRSSQQGNTSQDLDIETDNPGNTTDGDDAHDGDDDEGDDDDDDNEDDKLKVRNTPMMLGLLEAMFILWSTIRQLLSEESNADLKKHLDKRLALAFIQMDGVFKDPAILSVLISMTSYLPVNYVPTINRSWLPKLRSLTNENTEEEFSDLVVSLCEIGHASDVFELAMDWIKPSLETKRVDSPSCVPSKKARRVRICDPLQPQPLLGIKILGFMFADKITNSIIMETEIPDVQTVRNLLNSSLMAKIQAYLQTSSGALEEKDVTFLTLAFTLYWRILFHLHTQEKNTYNSSPEMSDILCWAMEHVTPSLVVGGERNAGSDTDDNRKQLAVNIIESLLELVCVLFACDTCDSRVSSTAIDFLGKVLRKDPDLELLPKLLPSLQQYVDFVKYSTDPEVTSDSEHNIPTTLSHLFVSVSMYIKKHGEASVKVLIGSKADMSNMMKAIYTKHNFPDVFLDNIMLTILAMIMAEMVHTSQQFDLVMEPDLSTLPMMSKWLMEIIQRQTETIKVFIKNLKDHSSASRVDTNVHSIHREVHLLGALLKCKCSQADLKPILDSLTVTLDKLTDTLDAEETDRHKDVLTSIKTKMEQCKGLFAAESA